jgi:hypothetical protein
LKHKEPSIVPAAKIEDLAGTAVEYCNWGAALEAEAVLKMLPLKFTEKAQAITLDQALATFEKMGISVPQYVTLDNLISVLKQTPDLRKEQIEQFSKLINEIK